MTEAAELSEAADAALSAQQLVRAVLGTDVRSALDRLKIVDSTLATLRRREIATWSSEPAEYVVALLWTPPDDAGRARRWQQGTVEIEDWRRSLGLTDGADSPNASTHTLGPPSEGWEGRRRRRVVTNVVAVPSATSASRTRSCSGRERRSFARPGDERGAHTEVEAASHRLFLGCGMLRSSGEKGEVHTCLEDLPTWRKRSDPSVVTNENGGVAQREWNLEVRNRPG